ncbi:MAG: DUF4386 family protein [Rhodobiaceae bacterium]|nr:DUF4386 family protein [Rhodobiaceae bacterium]
MSTSQPQQATRSIYLAAAGFLVLHIVILFGGFTALAVEFQFPDVLRLPTQERLALFRENQPVIVATYWALTMSGFTQIFAAVFLALALRPYRGGLITLALVFGTITGVGQAMGFGRWAILMPYLAEQMADPTISASAKEMIGLIEGSFNRYAGMVVGEHLSNIAMGFWLFFAGLGIRKSGVLDRRLGTMAVALSPILFILAAEQLGYAESALALITNFGLPLLAILHFGLAWQLIRRQGLDPAPNLGVGFAVTALVLYSTMVTPTLIS